MLGETLMGIDSQTQDRYFSEIIRTVSNSSEPLKIPQLLTKVQAGNQNFEKEIIVALLWQMLANRKLRFDESRRIQLSR
jgi:hypothetical protein